MQISKGKMVIHLEENIETLKETIEELKHVKEVLVSSAEYKLLNGKTQSVELLLALLKKFMLCVHHQKCKKQNYFN